MTNQDTPAERKEKKRRKDIMEAPFNTEGTHHDHDLWNNDGKPHNFSSADYSSETVSTNTSRNGE